MLKQNKFFSIISILGTALAIMMIMVIIVTDGIKNVSVAPENNRDKTLYLYYHTLRDSTEWGKSTYSGTLPYNVIKDYIPLLLKTPEMISAHSLSFANITTELSPEKTRMIVRYTDMEYWKFLTIPILEGRKFTNEEFLSGNNVAIISENKASQLFKGETAMGQHINIDNNPYRIIGITKTISPIFTQAITHVWVPYTSVKDTEQLSFTVMLFSNDKNDIKAIKNELREIEKKYKYDYPSQTLNLRGPETHRIKAMDIRGENDDNVNDNFKISIRKILFILLIILLIPAINLSGLTLSRMKKRTSEIGVRKAFGAKRHIILIQVLCENLITSFTGGIIGLALSIVVIFQMKEWLLGVPADCEIPFDVIFSIPVILSVFATCVIINILSAAIPACRASRMTIINAITNNDKIT